MAWNNWVETTNFDKEQKANKVAYAEAGMNDYQINEMTCFDESVLLSERRYREHTVSLRRPGNVYGDYQDAPLRAEVARMPTTNSDVHMRYWWIEELDDPVLINAVHDLKLEEIELITLIVYEGFSQTDVAKIFKVSQSAIGKRLKKIFKKISKMVLKSGFSSACK